MDAHWGDVEVEDVSIRHSKILFLHDVENWMSFENNCDFSVTVVGFGCLVTIHTFQHVNENFVSVVANLCSA